MIFLGEYKTSVTPGNRIAIPKQLRKQLMGDKQINNVEVIITRGYEPCMVIVTKDSFSSLLDGVDDMPYIATDKRDTARFLMSGAHEVALDKQGRFVMPDSLINHASVNSKEVVFLGVGSWIEVWDSAKWEAYQKELGTRSTEIAERLLEKKSD